MSRNEGYDGTVSLSRKLTEEESRELKITLLPYFTTETGVGVDDITDYLDYTFTMVSNSKDVTYVVKELEGLCSPEVSLKIGRELAAFIHKLKDGDGDNGANRKKDSGGFEEGKRVISLKKSTEEKGNALTMAGALGASREGGRNNKEKVDKGKPEKGEDNNEKRIKREDGNRNDRRDSDRRDGDRKGGRGSRSVQGAAFERLSNGSDRGRDDLDRRRDDRGGRGRGRGRDDRNDGFDRRREDRGGRGGRGHGARGPRDTIERGGRDQGRSGRGGRGDRMAGNRRSRDALDDEPDFVPAIDRGGRGRGRGREARDGPKRPRYDEGYDDGYGHDDYGDGYGHGGYGYNDDGYGYQPYPPFRGGGRGGRGRFGGRSHGHGVRGFEERSGDAKDAGMEVVSERHENGDNGEGGENIGHPSPMVQASLGGRGGLAFRGRGFVRGGRGRGRGHFGGRAQVVNMIASKTWVRKKDGDNDYGGDNGGGEGGGGES